MCQPTQVSEMVAVSQMLPELDTPWFRQRGKGFRKAVCLGPRGPVGSASSYLFALWGPRSKFFFPSPYRFRIDPYLAPEDRPLSIDPPPNG